MNTSTPSLLPYLESERHFRKYEYYIKTIVDKWPQLCVFTPVAPVASVETLSTRIRIAIKSLRANQWTVTDFNFAKFIQICDEITVSTRANPGKVTCGPEDLVRKAVPLGVKVEEQELPPSPSIRINLINPSDDLITAVMVLHHHQLLIEPSTIKCDADLRTYQELYDVSVTKEGDVYTIL